MKICSYQTQNDENGRLMLVKESEHVCESLEAVKEPEDIAKMMKEIYKLDKRAEEYAYVIGMNNAGIVVGVCEISHGTVDRSVVSSFDVFKRLLLLGTPRFLFVHNHPAGNPAPSAEDRDLTQKIRQDAILLNMELLDHIIIFKGGYTSFKKLGLIK